MDTVHLVPEIAARKFENPKVHNNLLQECPLEVDYRGLESIFRPGVGIPQWEIVAVYLSLSACKAHP